MEIKLLYFPGCPNFEETREALQFALKRLGLTETAIEEVNIYNKKTPESLKNYPSPTILVNGRDIEGQKPNDALACRIYEGKGGIPDVETISAALKKYLK